MRKKATFWEKLYTKAPTLCFDILAVPIAWFLAYWLRYNMQPFQNSLKAEHFIAAMLILTAVQVACYYYFKVYRGLWRFSSVKDVERIFRAVISASILVIPVFYITALIHDIPRTALPLYDIILILLLCAGRLFLRVYLEKQKNPVGIETAKRVLIVGAGSEAASLIRDLKRIHLYLPIGIVDDNRNNLGLEINGVRVVGTISELPHLTRQHQVDLILIAILSASSTTMQRIIGYCENCNIPFRTLPSIQALASGNIEAKALRDVKIEDLLGRDQIDPCWDNIRDTIKDKRVLVTGAGGSIGSELCRQIMSLSPSVLIMLDKSEFNLYKLDLELSERFQNIPTKLALINVTDDIAVNCLFNAYKPEIIFHAAAYKHVPMLEKQVRTAVHNNVLGTKVIAEASVAINAEKFILISTDKAVNPTNVMGATKRVAEIYCQNLNTRVSTQFITVRFGNVLGSVGSVVPLFQEQLKQGGPLTVTHPDIQRYFMTISEACQLILQAMTNGSGGEIFVLDMGEPIKISYLAEQMIRLAGKKPGVDIDIRYTGLRPGEKLYEELFHESEHLLETEHVKLFKARFRQMDWNELCEAMRLFIIACQDNDDKELHVLLNNLVPEFRSNSMNYLNEHQTC